MKHHEFHAIEADPEGVKLLAAAVTLLRIKKQNQCLITCLKDARAALETPGDLSKTDLRHLIEDINTLLRDVDAKDNGETDGEAETVSIPKIEHESLNNAFAAVAEWLDSGTIEGFPQDKEGLRRHIVALDLHLRGHGI
jgi:hypothetical protein